MSQSASHRLQIDEHLMPLDQVCKRYEVNIDAAKPQASEGLSLEQVKQRLVTYGHNVMTPPKQVPWILKYLIALSNLFNVLLLVSGILCFILLAVDPVGNRDNIYIGSVLIGVAMINAMIEFVQEVKSEAALKSFLDLVPRKCYAVRKGQTLSSEAADLVPGDVVCVKSGDKIPADILLVYANEFKVDNSSLTGEADPQERIITNKHTNPLEATNLAFNGTLAVNGDAYGLVIRTGDQTVLGQIANLAGSEKKRPSPLTQEITRFVHIIAGVAFVCAVVFFGVGFRLKDNFSYNLSFAIGVFVSFVPEGLPATVTMLLSIAAKRMASRNVLVKDLKGVETLGAITCLATDKTGTLTRNQMTVTNIWTGLKMYDAFIQSEKKKKKQVEPTTVDYGKDGTMYAGMSPMTGDNYPRYDYSNPECADIANICYMCSKAKYDRTDLPIKQRTIIGDATETGLFMFSGTIIPDSDKTNDLYPKVFEIPFNSTNKWHLTIHKKTHENGVYTLYIKGAPERIFRLCSSISSNGKIDPMTDSHQTQFLRAYETMAAKGHRVIGCAKFLLPGDQYPEGFIFKKDDKKDEKPVPEGPSGLYPQSGYTFMGLVSLEDPPKHGVREAVGQCRQAGIKVMMVTGDHPLTAEAIGRKINLMLQETREMVAKRTGRALNSIQEHEYNSIVIHGEQIDKLTEEDWERILDKEEIIFARTSPKHKLQIVKRCQARGHIVGVTGDGVNDSPALKKADLGIAMNISGSDVSKEAAAMILLDDNFASTVLGIQEGRLIFQNLKKSIKYTVTHTMPQVLANLAYIIAQVPLPLSPIQIIFIDLGFELFLSLTYAWEVPEFGADGLMMKLPRKPVTNKSIDLLRRENAALDAKKKEIEEWVHGPSDSLKTEEEQKEDEKKGNKFLHAIANIKFFLSHLFDKKLWSLYWEPREETILVDTNVLSWAYLEAGILMTLGCFAAYFHSFYRTIGWTPADAVAVNDRLDGEFTGNAKAAVTIAQSSYYFAILIQQIFNIFICKVTVRFPFGKMLFQNRATWYGILSGVAFAVLFTYAIYPAIVGVPLAEAAVSPEFWISPLIGGVVLLGYSCLRIAYLRRRQPVNLNLALPLDLNPTRWSTKSGH